MSCAADRKSTRLNSSHLGISYAVFCLKKKTGHVDEAPAVPGLEAGYCLGGGVEVREVCYARAARPPRSARRDSSRIFFFFLMIRRPPRSTPFPYTPPFR